ncbi:hypothetical protein [Vibrio cyclitrophicus]|uniref:hypothetical protein n=1 Tax=Vibrio cyclitrophicus TaxID=47951 RepID=UPI0011B56184|nr:hypothetical protein [Vibrio cyclitrophicus]
MKVHENTTNLPSRWVNAMFIFMTLIAMVAGYLSELTNIYGTFVVLPFSTLIAWSSYANVTFSTHTRLWCYLYGIMTFWSLIVVGINFLLAVTNTSV